LIHLPVLVSWSTISSSLSLLTHIPFLAYPFTFLSWPTDLLFLSWSIHSSFSLVYLLIIPFQPTHSSSPSGLHIHLPLLAHLLTFLSWPNHSSSSPGLPAHLPLPAYPLIFLSQSTHSSFSPGLPAHLPRAYPLIFLSLSGSLTKCRSKNADGQKRRRTKQ
jgi:hypothetical protein